MGTKERITFAKDPEKFIERAITKFVQESPANRRKVDGRKYWDTPWLDLPPEMILFSSSIKRSLEDSTYSSEDLRPDLWKEQKPPESVRHFLGPSCIRRYP